MTFSFSVHAVGVCEVRMEQVEGDVIKCGGEEGWRRVYENKGQLGSSPAFDKSQHRETAVVERQRITIMRPAGRRREEKQGRGRSAGLLSRALGGWCASGIGQAGSTDGVERVGMEGWRVLTQD